MLHLSSLLWHERDNVATWLTTSEDTDISYSFPLFIRYCRRDGTISTWKEYISRQYFSNRFTSFGSHAVHKTINYFQFPNQFSLMQARFTKRQLCSQPYLGCRRFSYRSKLAERHSDPEHQHCILCRYSPSFFFFCNYTLVCVSHYASI
jgi:hypothetical protein